MKLITAIIQPYRLDPVREALEAIGLTGATISEASGTGRHLVVAHQGLETDLRDDEVAAAVEAISGAARTGNIGDGKIWVSPVEDVIRVRTGESGPSAL